jgi:hypothetical protein
MKKLINSFALRVPVAFILFCLPTINLLAQNNPCTKGNFYSESNCKAARSAFKSASAIVTGIVLDDSYISEWIGVASASPNWQIKINEGLKFSDAVSFLKQYMAEEKGITGLDGVAERAITIDNAFREVYGHSSTPLEQASWEVQVKAQKACYATIWAAELKKIISNRELRIPIIQKAYTDAMGRMPTADDMNYWKPRNEHYRLLVDACRAWLYSEAGAKDLIETITRAWKVKYKNTTPTDNEIKEELIRCTKSKLIYSEMNFDISTP